MTDSEKLKNLLEDSEYAVFFGGAGTSTASGIPDFRSANGVFSSDYDGLSPEEIVSDDYFYGNTEKFYDFYKKRMLFPNAEPNKAHKKLAELEEKGIIKAVITQNIDGLHQKAGSKNVLELHGSALRNRCIRCGKRYGVEYILSSERVPRCTCGGIIKPDVVLYGEALDETVMDNATKEISKSDLLIVGGTSLTVYPAAAFIRFFRGKNLVVINKTATYADENADLVIRGNIAEVFDF